MKLSIQPAIGPLVSALAAGCTSDIKAFRADSNTFKLNQRMIEETILSHDSGRCFKVNSDVAQELLKASF